LNMTGIPFACLSRTDSSGKCAARVIFSRPDGHRPGQHLPPMEA
jgi:hypothetical protein